MKGGAVITQAAGPAQPGGLPDAPAWIAVSAPSGLFATRTAAAGLAAGRRLIRVAEAVAALLPTLVPASCIADGAPLSTRSR